MDIPFTANHLLLQFSRDVHFVCISLKLLAVNNILYKPPLKYYLLFQFYFVERWLQECLIIITICVSEGK